MKSRKLPIPISGWASDEQSKGEQARMAKLFGAAAGALIGSLTSDLIIPYFRFTGQMASALPPLIPVIAQDQVRNLAAFFAVVVVLAEVVTISSVLRRQLVGIIKTIGV